MKTRYWLIIIALILICFGVREIMHQKNNDNLVSNISIYKDSVKFERLKNGALVSYNSSLKLETSKQISDLASHLNDTLKTLIKQFKSVKSVTYLTNNYLLSKDSIKIDSSKIPCNFKPFNIKQYNPNYTFSGTLSRTNFVIDTMFIPNKISIVYGIKKTGFLKYDDVVAITNSNPLMVTSNITDYRLDPPKKFYNHTWFHWLEGIAIYSVAKFGINTYLK